MTKTKNKWGFLAPTRAEAERMEKKYKVHFTPLIDYMKVIFPDIDDWEEDDDITIKGLHVGAKITSHKSRKAILICTDGDFRLSIKPEKNWSCYYIDFATQLTNATVKQIFGVEVKEHLFDENTPTYTQPWVEHIVGNTAETSLKGKYVGDKKQYQVNFDAYHAKYDNIGLSKIIVEKLFDLYDYEIDLNTDEKISILIGPNGCGKTTLLKIVRFMLSGIGDIKEILKIPFKSITCLLVNGKKIKLKSFKNKLCAYIDNKKIAVFYENEDNYNEDEEFASWVRVLTKELQENTELTIKKTHDLMEGTDCNEEEILNKDKELLTDVEIEMQETLKDSLSETAAKIIFEQSLEKYGCYFDVKFMSAQRLFDNIGQEEKGINTHINNIFKVQNDFIQLLENFEKKSSQQKIEILSNIKLFQEIINKRINISQKQLQCRFGKMFLTIGEGKNKKEIPLDVLSSGEKNDFIMFYNLIFNCENSKVLIDEPEISQHIEWQERFIDDLYNICKLKNIQALIATHSPNIINGHLDLIAKWKGQNEY